MDMSAASISTRVAIVGSGWTGIIAAREVADFGFGVLLIHEHGEAEGPEGGAGFPDPTLAGNKQALQDAAGRLSQRENVRMLSGAKLTCCRGSIGSYTLCLETEEGIAEETVGAVVLATNIRAVPLIESYGLGEAKNAITLSRLESVLDPDREHDGTTPALNPGDRIAFLSGFVREGDTLTHCRILNCLHRLDEMGCRTYLYTRNLKVAEEGLEELAKEDRRLGTVFFKLEERPALSTDGSLITHLDPVLEREIQLEPTLIVLEEELLPGSGNRRLAGILNITPAGDGFLQEENVHRLPVRTNRLGVYSVGSARGIMTPEQIRSDAANAALAVKDDLDALRESLFGARASINEDKCCACLTCYRLCPHGAISLADRPVISSLTCQACGLCASHCPQEAISIHDIPWADIKHSVAESLRTKKGDSPRIVAYCCRNSAYEAGMAAYAFERDLPSGLEIVAVPCAGSVNRDMILSSLEEGADGLLVLGCHSGACKSTWGTAFAGYQSERLGAILEEVGLSRERICFRTLAENMDADFAAYARKMEQDLMQLGANPLAGKTRTGHGAASEQNRFPIKQKEREIRL
jgi:heterodisulfide reductase subunit A-like polyferredoxin/coenzyme F420-reducing hydrogenase delta subunit